ncbi:molybdate ABC transporter substrate-binding protein [Flagellimonas flava]|uniref:Molybdate transport system substrate-binding protein n=1 Tax=Flagellimonas flava TaxID=570519 RepID=A0A1M5IDJ3_9FLAO|nr:molybdate ABC transporter substrate-binding protein [Allomuricauda flava]SHG25980.1 molybdate transport system substrate-binding protein [Allomuricauda flava]
MKFRRFSVSLLLLAVLACRPSTEVKLTIAVAANMQYAISEIVEAFTNKTEIQCNLIIGSSGKLTAQIKEGAPYDVFLSANMKYPMELFDDGLTTAPPKVYANGGLVLWTQSDQIVPSLTSLTNKDVKHIALANPEIAPYGRASIQVLRNLDLHDTLVEKLVYAESISQTNQFISTGVAQIGFTAKSVVLSPDLKGKGKWKTLDPKYYDPVQQGIVLTRRNENRDNSPQRFFDFIFSEEARKILEKYGYSMDE